MTLTRQVLALSATVLSLAGPAAHAQSVLLDEGFNSVSTLSAAGWVLNNQSSPVGQDWFQGNSAVFAAQAGSADAYVAANFLSAANGTGSLANWLITPALALGGNAGTLSFWVNADQAAGFADGLNVMLNSTGSTTLADFSTTALSISAVTGSWTQFTVALPAGMSSARIGFVYTASSADTANYLGLDSVTVTAVPEPASYGLMALGALVVGAALRRRQQARSAA